VKAGADVLAHARVTSRPRSRRSRPRSSAARSREERIDTSVRRLLELKVRTGAIQRPFVDLDSLRVIVGSAGASPERAQAIAERAVTMLRNDDHQLPLATGANVPRTAIITFAGEIRRAVPVVRSAPSCAQLRAAERACCGSAPTTPRARLDSLVRPT
jgi:beta-glucosidase-like glycosyl hydrolase